MGSRKELDQAIDTALEHTKDAQGLVREDLDRELPATNDATIVARRADDLSQLADEAASDTTLATEEDDGAQGSPGVQGADNGEPQQPGR